MIRPTVCALLALAAAALLATPAPHARAQGWFSDRDRSERIYVERERRYRDAVDDAYFERRTRYYRRDAVARREAARRFREVEEEPRGGMNFFQRLFGGRSREDDSGWRGGADPGAVEVRPKPRRVQRKRPLPPAAVAAAPPGAPGDPAAVAPGQPSIPAVAAVLPPSTFVAVIGDSVADGLAGGLQEGFADTSEVEIKRVVKANSGLVRDDYFDFPSEIEKALAAGPVTYAVFDVGVNDRQPFLDMRKEPPLSEAWRKRYVERIDAVLKPVRDRKIPIFWVGLAASGSSRATADHTAINAIAKERVEAAGGTYVDVWEGFVDEGGAYAEFGPKLDGQVGRLRLDDGVHFSKAGARKLSHYVEQEIRKIFQPRPATPDAMMAAVSPQPGEDGAPAPGPAAERPRPIASPVMVLTAAQRAASGSLAATPMTVPARDASESAARVLVRGEAPDADPGRMDDHRWPGAEPKAQPASALLDQATPPPPAPAEAARPAPVDPTAAITDPRPLAHQPQR